jgi:hypothetical protein
VQTRDHHFSRLSGGLLLMLAALATAPAAHAQSATSDSRAVTIGPLSVVNTAPLEFGDMIAGASAGTVFIDTRNNNVTSSGGVTLAGGNPSRANFIIYGTRNQVVDVTIAGSTTITHANGTDSMLINQMGIGNGGRNFGTFVRGRLPNAGVYNLTVGGRLNVDANQTDGEYSGTFTMTVDYL